MKGKRRKEMRKERNEGGNERIKEGKEGMYVV